jgi:hypothetical protein
VIEYSKEYKEKILISLGFKPRQYTYGSISFSKKSGKQRYFECTIYDKDKWRNELFWHLFDFEKGTTNDCFELVFESLTEEQKIIAIFNIDWLNV